MRLFKHIFWNEGESRLRAGIRIFLSLLVFFLVYRGYLLILNSMEVKLIYSGQSPLGIFLIAGTLRLFPAVLVVLFCGRFMDRRKIANFGFHLKKNWWIDLCFGMGLGAFLMALLFAVQFIFGWISISHAIHFNQVRSGFVGPFLVFLFYLLCLGIAEELLSRGYLIKNLAEGFNLKHIGPKGSVMTAWMLTSVIFGLAHLGNPGSTAISAINLVMIGITMGAGFVLTGELAIPIGLHVSWNFFQGIVFGFPVSGLSYPAEIVSLIKINQLGPEIWTGGSFGPEGGLLGMCASVLGMVMILAWVAIRRGKRFCQIHTALVNKE